MHIFLTVPNPLASLTRILVALERGRGGVDSQSIDQSDVPDRCDKSRRVIQADSHHDLGSLSLNHCGSDLDQQRDGLEFFSMSYVERTPPGRRDSLGDLSLTRGFPPRPGA